MVTFPALGLEFNIDKVAISIGNINIYWYAIIIVAGFVVGILLSKKDDGKYGVKFDDILELLIFLIPISVVCARLYYVVFNISYYSQNLLDIFNVRNGGLAIYGGIIGAVATVAVFCKIKKLSLLDVTDYLVPFLALGQAIGRWGNFFNVEAYGTETSSFLRMGIWENGIYKEVHPTFLYESVCTFLVFILLYKIRNKRKYKGQLTYIYLALYGLVRAIIEGLRTDSLMLGSLRISQVLSIVLCIAFTVILIYKKINKNVEKSL